MIAPAHQHAEVWQDRIVQQQHIQCLNRRAQEQHEKRHHDEFGTMIGPYPRWFTFHQIDDAAHIIDQADLDRGHDKRHQRREIKKRPKPARERQKKRPQPFRWLV